MSLPPFVTWLTFQQGGPSYLCSQLKRKNMATVNLTADKFREEIFDYTTQKEWQFKGQKPAIIDFYADWCGPCKMVAPLFEELSEEYAQDITIYKVDTEVEQELAAMFGIQSIPSILFIPMNKTPMMQKGALPKQSLKKVIEEELLTSAPSS